MIPLSWLLAATPSADAALLGYTGLLNVPTAEVRQDLGIAFRWLDAPEPLLQPPGTAPIDRTYSVVLPFFPFLEGTLSLVQVIGWVDPETPVLPYAVHRSFSAKCGFPLGGGVSAALGLVDPVSANFLNRGEVGRTQYGLTTGYGAVSWRFAPLLLTLGWGAGDTSSEKDSRKKPFLHGPFGGAVLALPGGLEALGEYDGITPNYGLRWALPGGLGIQGGSAGGGWTAGASLGVKL